MKRNDCFRYQQMGLGEDILRRKLWGDLKGAARLIDLRLADPATPEELRASLLLQKEMLRRLPKDYPYSRQEAMAIIRSRIPDFTPEEFQQRMDLGQIGWIYLEGQERFFDRFYPTLCKTDPSFARRAGEALSGAESAKAGERGAHLLNEAMARMKEEGSLSRRITIRAGLRLKEEHFTPGMHLLAHLPVPIPCAEQSEVVIHPISPAGAVIDPEDAPQRTVHWEGTFRENPVFQVEYSYLRRASYHAVEAIAPSGAQPGFLTGEEMPHIRFTPYLRSLAQSLTRGAEGPLEKARRFYDFITLNMTYTFMPAYFVLENIPENCARTMTGDCGVFALLFLTLCRIAGIPAQWQSGLAAEPGFCGGHDWVRFYIAPYGWLFADPSYGVASRRQGNEERRQFYFGNLDPYRMTANSAFQAPFLCDKEGWRADPYDNQVGEVESAGRGYDFDEFDRWKEVLACTPPEEKEEPT